MDLVGGELKTRNEQKEMERWEMPEERYEGWQVEGRCAPRWEEWQDAPGRTQAVSDGRPAGTGTARRPVQ